MVLEDNREENLAMDEGDGRRRWTKQKAKSKRQDEEA